MCATRAGRRKWRTRKHVHLIECLAIRREVALGPARADGVDFVDEDDRRRLGLCRLEEIADACIRCATSRTAVQWPYCADRTMLRIAVPARHAAATAFGAVNNILRVSIAPAVKATAIRQGRAGASARMARSAALAERTARADAHEDLLELGA